MDIESIHAIKMLKAMAYCNSRFSALAREIRGRDEVITVSQRLECLIDQGVTFIEGYVDAELDSGKAIAFFLEIRWDDYYWFIDSSVLLNDAVGQDAIVKFPKRIASTLDDCTNQLAMAITDLLENASTIDIKRL